MKRIQVLKKDAKTGEILDKYYSIREAARLNYCDPHCISWALNGRQHTAIGYKWEVWSR